jgi:hypothetical protein
MRWVFYCKYCGTLRFNRNSKCPAKCPAPQPFKAKEIGHLEQITRAGHFVSAYRHIEVSRQMSRLAQSSLLAGHLPGHFNFSSVPLSKFWCALRQLVPGLLAGHLEP